MIILYSTAALAAGFALDLILGDPPGFPHIVRAMGVLISALEHLLRRLFHQTPRGELFAGATLCVAVVAICFVIPFAALRAAYALFPALGFALESLMCYQLLAVKCLRDESMRVHAALAAGDTAFARKRIAMLVGRDTDSLNDAGIARAAVETVAENTSDGVVAPLVYIMLGGAALGCLYKAVNTMDSMVGYKNERYLYFGRAAARLDDVLNYIPSRLAALLMLLSSALLGLDVRGAYRIWKRDRRNHESPNSAQTESVCAGALGVRLAGPAAYFGVTRVKPYIGDDLKPITAEDIRQTNRLLYASALLALMVAVVIRGGILAAI